MDPLTTLLAAAAATGPNTFQSQALTALRSAGPQESYFTRMGNPHPLQMPQLGQPTAPQLNPIITQPVVGTNGPRAADPHANFATGTPNGRASNHWTTHSNVAGHPQDATTSRPITHDDANNAADSDRATTGSVTKRPDGVHPGQFSLAHPKTAGRFGSAGDAGSASTTQQRTQHSAAWPSDRNRGTCTKRRRGLHTAYQRRTTSFGDRTGGAAPPSFRTTHSTTKGETDAPSALHRPQQEPLAATAPTPPQVQKPPPGSAILQPQGAQNPSAPTKDPSDQIPKPPQPGPSFHPPQPFPTWQAASTRPTAG